MPSQIKVLLDKIKTAVYGIEVRDAIHDSIAECYDNVAAGQTLAGTAAESASAAATAAQEKAALADEKAALADAAAANATSVAERVETAVDAATEAAKTANAAADNADEKAALADGKAMLADTAAQTAAQKTTELQNAAKGANDAADAANAAAENANTKAGLVDEKAALAAEKAALADEKAALADTAAANANAKASLADTAATNAGLAKDAANEAAEKTAAATTAANTAAQNAADKAALADTAATAANTAAAAATDAAGSANAAKTACETATAGVESAVANADAKAELANTAAANADAKAELADAAAENANAKATLANTKAELADEKANLVTAKIAAVDDVVARAEEAIAEANEAAKNASEGVIGKASGSVLGGVTAESRTAADTQPVRIDPETARLYTAAPQNATAETAGVVLIGDNLKLNADGKLSVDTSGEIADSPKPVTAAAVQGALQGKQAKIAARGILKGDGAGGVTAAAAGTDYVAPVSGKGLSANDFTDEAKEKLDGVAANANKYVHPAHTAHESGFYKVTVDAEGHVTAAAAIVKGDVTALGIPAQDTVYENATAEAAGLLSAADKAKLDGVEAGAQKNVTPAWADVTGRPDAFPPVAHAHAISDVTGLESALDGKVSAEEGKSLSTNDYTTAEKQKLAGLKAPVALSVNLTAEGWSENSQTVSATGVTADSLLFAIYAPESRAVWVEADIYCSAQGEGTLTFACTETAPTQSVTANIVILG